ncbi:alpha-amylase family glycosyl hydrolase [Streptomyces brasiliscabiei]|uniref:alpha-amylase family glycosyl hydrolase n=1 Tax=Streptomyces brasiliscabiei TaxID=2736302 RepID=UPI0038F6151B
MPDGDWCLHLYAPEQPDLDGQHPYIHAEFESILRFWFSRGVDGFRIDVAHGPAKDPVLPALPDLPPLPAPADGRPRPYTQHPHWDRDEVHAIYRTWRRIADEFGGERAFVAEAWADTSESLAAYVRPGGLRTAFNFIFPMGSWDAKDLRSVIDDSLATLNGVGAPATWVLHNHDVMRHTSRYARTTVARWVPNQRYRPEGGIDLELGTRCARAAALLMLALPGGAYIGQTLTWVDAPAGALAFRRDPGLLCVVSLSDEPYRLPARSRLRPAGRRPDHGRTPGTGPCDLAPGLTVPFGGSALCRFARGPCCEGLRTFFGFSLRAGERLRRRGGGARCERDRRWWFRARSR